MASETVERRLNELAADIFADIRQTEIDYEYDKAQAEPEKYKLTRVMQHGKPLNYRYWTGGGVPGCRVRFCYMSWRNAAGYFLSFREVWDAKKSEGYRDKWVAHKKRRLASDTAERWARDSLADAMRKSGKKIAEAIR